MEEEYVEFAARNATRKGVSLSAYMAGAVIARCMYDLPELNPRAFDRLGKVYAAAQEVVEASPVSPPT